jgi:hypothetical protein
VEPQLAPANNNQRTTKRRAARPSREARRRVSRHGWIPPRVSDYAGFSLLARGNARQTPRASPVNDSIPTVVQVQRFHRQLVIHFPNAFRQQIKQISSGAEAGEAAEGEPSPPDHHHQGSERDR